MWTASLSQKTEVKQIGLDFPTQQRQSTCCEAELQMAFDPRNLLIRMGQCVLHVLLVDPTKLLSSFFPVSWEMSVNLQSQWLFAAFNFSVWLNESTAFLHTIHTPASTHTALSAHVDSSCVALSSVCFDVKSGLLMTAAATRVIHRLIYSQCWRGAVVSLTSFHFRSLIVRPTCFHYHDPTIDTCDGKEHLKHTTLLLLLLTLRDNHANIIFFFFAPWDFFSYSNQEVPFTLKCLLFWRG